MNKIWEKEKIHEKVSPTLERTIVHLDNLMVVACDFSGGPWPRPEAPHSHSHEQITYIAEGEVEFFREREKHNLKKGDLIVIPSEVPHCIRLISTNGKLIDSFSPVRNDFLKEKDVILNHKS